MKKKGSSKEHAKSKFLGVVAIVLGILALLAPGITGYSITLLVGILVTIAGILRLFWAFEVENFGRGILTFLLGILTLIVGFAMLANPYFASGLLAIFLAAYFIADGIVEIIAGIVVRGVTGWGWLIFGGIISLLLGLIIIEKFPLSGDLAIGILFGIKMFLIGLIMVGGGDTARKQG